MEEYNKGRKDVTNDKLVAHYSFENDASDVSGNGNDGVLQDGAKVEKVDGGNALVLDGINDYVEVLDDDNDLNIRDTVTVSLWFKSDVVDDPTGEDKWAPLVTKSTDNYRTGRTYLMYRYNLIPRVYSFTRDLTRAQKSVRFNGVEDDKWYHYVTVIDRKDANKITGYLKGVKIRSTDLGINTLSQDSSGFPLLIGSGDENLAGFDKFFKGKIDEVKIWNYALSEEEILEEYNKGRKDVVKNKFVKAVGKDFYINGMPFYFGGTNNYYLRYGDSDCIAYDENGGCSKEVLDDASEMGLKVIRTWGFTDGPYYWGSLQPALGVYDDEVFKQMDLLIKEAEERDLKLIIPLVNNWPEYGGMCQYVSWCGISNSNQCDPSASSGIGSEVHDEFYTNLCTRNAFKSYINYVLNRKNNLTGRYYKDEPSVFAWELGNEPRARSDPTGDILDSWVEEMSSYIKSIDSNHMVTTGIEGFNIDQSSEDIGLGTEGTDFVRNHNHQGIDFATFHMYPDHWEITKERTIQWIQEHVNDAHNVLGKPVIVEEFGKQGSLKEDYMQDWYNLFESEKVNGNLFWHLVDHNYIWEDGFSVNYPEDTNIISLITEDANYWDNYNQQLSPSNDAPVLNHISDIVVDEGDLVEISVNAFDSNGDYIFYSINDAYHFDKTETGFEWQTYIGLDSGEYDIIIKASDGISWDTETIHVVVNPVAGCLRPIDGMQIGRDVTLCTDSYYLPNGIAVADDVTLDCDGAEIQGDNVDWGITLSGNNIVIKNCIITEYSQCVQLLQAENIQLLNNEFLGGCYQGINIRESNNIDVINNKFKYNADIGLYAYHSTDIIVQQNTLEHNGKGIYWDGGSLSKIELNSFTSNYGGAIYLLASSDDNEIINNIMNNNGISWGQGGGISLQSSSNNFITENEFSNNYQAFNFAPGSINNFVYHNNIKTSMVSQAIDTGANSWDYNNEGNYWSDYDSPGEGCIDSDLNGICDSPYVINAESKDNFPFFSPSGWENIPGCGSDSDCRADFYSENYCLNGDVYRDFHDFACINGKCAENIILNLMEVCEVGCEDGECIEPECYDNGDCDDFNVYTEDTCITPGTINSYCSHDAIECLNEGDCGTDGLIGDLFCSGDDVYQSFQEFECSNPGSVTSSCSDSTTPQLVEACADTCVNGLCVDVLCYGDSDCGTDGLIGDLFCSGDDVYQYFQEFECSNPGATQSYCSTTSFPQLMEECGVGCSGGECIVENCIVPYSGMLVTGEVVFCPGTYEIDEAINLADNSNLICDGTILKGDGSIIAMEMGSRGSVKNCILDNFLRVFNGYHDHNNIFENNTIVNSSNAFYLHDVQNTQFLNNHITNCSRGFHIWWHSHYNEFRDNVVENCSLGFYFDWHSGNNLFSGNKVNGNNNGFYHALDYYGTVYNNTFIDNEVKNNNHGFSLGRYEDSILRDNLIENNNYGVSLTNSNNNQVYHNNFVNNLIVSARDSNGDNDWDYNNQGNYWSDYDSLGEGCFDLDFNGICDSPYVMDIDGQDNFPFTTEGGWESIPACRNYQVQDLVVGSATEHRLYLDGHHFLTIIDDQGTFNIRPHPGEDVNGWGSSLYMQPFLPGAILKHTIIDDINIKCNEIEVIAHGKVSRGVSTNYGDWDTDLSFSYNPLLKKVNGWGEYDVNLMGSLSSSTGDLNLFKLASNYLDDVPLLNGGDGDTGDMKYADVSGKFDFRWNPSLQPSHFPYDFSDSLSIDVIGDYNQVDTVAQGYAYIEPAYKPSMKVILNSSQKNIPMIFGGMYDWGERKDFWEDNVGITPLIVQSSSYTDYSFDVLFVSEAIEGDGGLGAQGNFEENSFDMVLNSENEDNEKDENSKSSRSLGSSTFKNSDSDNAGVESVKSSPDSEVTEVIYLGSKDNGVIRLGGEEGESEEGESEEGVGFFGSMVDFIKWLF